MNEIGGGAGAGAAEEKRLFLRFLNVGWKSRELVLRGYEERNERNVKGG